MSFGQNHMTQGLLESQEKMVLGTKAFIRIAYVSISQ